jgi:hypothetical protein
MSTKPKRPQNPGDDSSSVELVITFKDDPTVGEQSPDVMKCVVPEFERVDMGAVKKLHIKGLL